MPARKRHRRPPEHPDPVVRFARAVDESDAKAKARVRQEQARRREEAERRKRAAEHAKAVDQARQQLDRAIADAKRARSSGDDVAEADAAWKRAKARVIELETGEAPDW